MVPYVEKSSKAVVFASPKKENYHELVKSGGMRFFMPPWSFDEVTAFCANLLPLERLDILVPWTEKKTSVRVDMKYSSAFLGGNFDLIKIYLIFRC